MTITRNNYEEFFLLYADHELSAADRKAVDHFVIDNPDLKKELNALQETVFSAEKSVVFDHKEILMKLVPGEVGISISNYLGYFLLYADNELDEPAKRQVQLFADQHPSLLLELSLILQARVEPDNSVVFKEKKTLYRMEEGRRITAFPWFRIAAAAVLVLVTGIFVISKKTGQIIAGSRPANRAIEKSRVKKGLPENSKQEPAVTYHAPSPLHESSAISENKEVKEEGQARQAVELSVNESSNNHLHKINHRGSFGESRRKGTVLPEQRDLASVGTKKTSLKLSAHAVVPSGSSLLDNPPVQLEVPADASARGAKPGTDPRMAVREDNNTEPDKIFYFAASEKKNKLRGLFRKVSRVLDKNTNADDDDNKHGILVGSFQIALK